ncbi:hypothetical protein SANTM175S_00658 [Streptomyces antimycoticus]
MSRTWYFASRSPLAGSSMEKVSVHTELLSSLWSSTEVRRMEEAPSSEAQRPITYQGVAEPSV